MVPILFNKTETAFTSNGLGRLVDCTRCIVTEERNGIYEVEFDYPITGSLYHKIVDAVDSVTGGVIIGVFHDDKQDLQPFDIYSYSAPINGIVTFYAHHISYRLNKVIVSPFETSVAGAALALTKLKQKSVNNNPFTFSTDMSATSSSGFNVTVPSNLRPLLCGSEGSIIDVFGGELEFDKFTVNLKNHRGQDTNVTIRYGKNLIDIKKEIDNSSVYNAVAPYWEGGEEDTLICPEGYIVRSAGSPSSMDTLAIPLDLSSEFDYEPDEEELVEKANEYLSYNTPWNNTCNITIDFAALWQTPEYENVVALQRVSLCDTVSVYYPELGVIEEKQKVIRTVYNVLLERYDSIELGDRVTTFGETITGDINSVIDSIPTLSMNTIDHEIEAAVNHATDMITGGLGGYVVMVLNANGQPQEICILNKPDIATADKVWRWNKNGLGHSNSYYNGTYDLAMTADGQIVADRITTGTLTANIIKAGLLQDAAGVNYWDMTTGDFRLASTATIAGSVIASQSDISGTVIATDVQYGNSSSSTTPPASNSWTTNAEWQKGKFLWTRVKMTMKNGTTQYSTARRIADNCGNGIKTVVEEYYLSTSNTSTAGGSWSSTQPAWVKGRYYWTRSKITWSDDSITYDPSVNGVLAAGMTTGCQSTDDLAAVTVVATDVQYGNSTSGTTPPTSWTTDASWVKGKYLWTREKMTLKSGTVQYSAARLLVGTDGLGVKLIEEQYYLSKSSSSLTGGSWSNSQQAWVKGRYYWTRNKITWSDNTVTYDPSSSGKLAQALTTGCQSTNDLDDDLNQLEIFNRLTNNGATQGIYLNSTDNKLYINASYIKSGTVSADYIKGGVLTLGGSSNTNGRMVVNDASSKMIAQLNNSGFVLDSGSTLFSSSGSVATSYTNPKYRRKMVFEYGAIKAYSIQVTDSSGTEITNPTETQIAEIFCTPDYCSVRAIKDLKLNGKNGSASITLGKALNNNTISRTADAYVSANTLKLDGIPIAWEWPNSSTNFYLRAQGSGGIYFWHKTTPITSASSLTGTYMMNIDRYGSMSVSGSFGCSGSKNRIISTEDYGTRLLYSYEMPTPMFGDIGEGIIGDDGISYIWLDPVFAKTISIKTMYQVFLQKYGSGDCWIDERKSDHFVVKGTPGLKFAWELKAKQDGYDQLRLEKKVDNNFEQVDYGTFAMEHLGEISKERSGI